jgi:hypothetical protein
MTDGLSRLYSSDSFAKAGVHSPARMTRTGAVAVLGRSCSRFLDTTWHIWGLQRL